MDTKQSVQCPSLKISKNTMTQHKWGTGLGLGGVGGERDEELRVGALGVAQQDEQVVDAVRDVILHIIDAWQHHPPLPGGIVSFQQPHL